MTFYEVIAINIVLPEVSIACININIFIAHKSLKPCLIYDNYTYY